MMIKFFNHIFDNQPNLASVMWIISASIITGVATGALLALSPWTAFGLVVAIFLGATVVLYKDMNNDKDR